MRRRRRLFREDKADSPEDEDGDYDHGIAEPSMVWLGKGRPADAQIKEAAGQQAEAVGDDDGRQEKQVVDGLPELGTMAAADEDIPEEEHDGELVDAAACVSDGDF